MGKQKSALLKALIASEKKWAKIGGLIRDTPAAPCALCGLFNVDDTEREEPCKGCPLKPDDDESGDCCDEWIAVRIAVSAMHSRISTELDKAINNEVG